MPRRLLERLRAGERGFTLTELLIAAGLSMIGLMAIMSSFDGSRSLVTAAERQQAASHRAPRALEDAVSRPYDDIGLQGTSAPPRSTDPNHPSNRITTDGTGYTFTTGQPAALFVLDGNLVHQEPWQDATDPRLSGQIYRYVTQYQDGTIAGEAGRGKRVTVAVTVAGRRRAVILSTIVRERD